MAQRLPPGKYYIGDPCYIFQPDAWQGLIDSHWDAMEHGEIFEFKGHQLWMHSTAHGDGVFEDQNGTEYGVDAGMLGVVPIELIDNPAGEENGTVLELQKGVTVEYDNGTFYMGPICVKTNSDIDSDFADDELDGGYDGDLDFDRF